MSLEPIQRDIRTPTLLMNYLETGHHPGFPGVAHSQIQLDVGGKVQARIFSPFLCDFPRFLKLAQNPISHPCSFYPRPVLSEAAMQAACPQLPPYPLPWGPPGSSQAVGTAEPSCLRASRPFLVHPWPSYLPFLPPANPLPSLLHSVPFLITTCLPDTFSHATTNTENLQLLCMGNHPHRLLKKNFFN